MIISISLENWMSFLDPTTFSMVASSERQHGQRVPNLKKYRTRILPIAAIYGGNASGKTNLFKAIHFAQWMVVRGTQPDAPIPVEPFRLNKMAGEKPSHFDFELLINETIYAFSFSVTRKKVLTEQLVQINSASETVLYERIDGAITFGDSLKNTEFLSFAFQGTRDNQLFLTNSVSQKVDDFRPVYDWFKNQLELIAPDQRFSALSPFLDENQPSFNKMNELLLKLDTGISRLGEVEVDLNNLSLPDEVINRLLEDIPDGETVRFFNESMNERFLISMSKGELSAKKLFSFHADAESSDVRFDIRQESDGSQRLIDLLPVFLDLIADNSKKVYIIDELDRSLHTALSRALLDYYLAHCTKESRAQLLLTTHDVNLMDQALFRRDEMWVAERDMKGGSSLLAFSEYQDVRYDKDIRKSYLQGRLGGMPRFLPVFTEQAHDNHIGH